MRSPMVLFLFGVAAAADTAPKTLRMPFEKPAIVQKRPGVLTQKPLAALIPPACCPMPILKPPANISRMPVLTPQADISRMPVLKPPPPCDQQ